MSVAGGVLSNAQKHLMKDAFSILLIQAIVGDMPKYYYLAIYLDSIPKLGEIISSGRDIEKIREIGIVIREGEGEPDEATYDFMQENYGLEKDAVQVITLKKRFQDMV